MGVGGSYYPADVHLVEGGAGASPGSDGERYGSLEPPDDGPPGRPCEGAAPVETPPPAEVCWVERIGPSGPYLTFPDGTGISVTVKNTTFLADLETIVRESTTTATFGGEQWTWERTWKVTRPEYLGGDYENEDDGEYSSFNQITAQQDVRSYGPATLPDGTKWFPDGSTLKVTPYNDDGSRANVTVVEWSGCIPWVQN